MLLAAALSMTCLAGPGTVMARAAEQPPAAAVVAQIDREDESTVYFQPRYTNISNISAGLLISSLGRAACTSTATMRNDYDGTLTMTLEQLDASDRWVAIKSWSTEFSGPEVVMLDKGYYVEKGFSYQVVTTVEIRDGNKVIEKVSHYSPMKTY